ncbi:MAG: alanine racemase [Armatimonadota bacterium]
MLLRPTVAEIDLDAIKWNLGRVRALVGPKRLICPAVKADGYGHGAVAVSRAALAAGADMLAVATLDEVVELREAGITAPILNFQCILPEHSAEVVKHDIITTICSRRVADELSRCAVAAGRTVRVHVKVDTGMGRVGVQAAELAQFAREVASLPGLALEGVYTHFPSADDDPEFTALQIAEFGELVGAVRVPIIHAANSAAIINHPEAYFDMVRPGIMLYGLYDHDTDVELRQAMALKSRIAYLKELPPGRTVSYGRTFTAKRPTKVATLPIGYADGYNRLLGNKASALVRGARVPVIGRVCMDQTMLDVTDVPAEVGDEVVLYGRQGDEFISIREIAGLLGTITYEVACAVGKRVPRRYVG